MIVNTTLLSMILKRKGVSYQDVAKAIGMREGDLCKQLLNGGDRLSSKASYGISEYIVETLGIDSSIIEEVFFSELLNPEYASVHPADSMIKIMLRNMRCLDEIKQPEDPTKEHPAV